MTDRIQELAKLSRKSRDATRVKNAEYSTTQKGFAPRMWMGVAMTTVVFTDLPITFVYGYEMSRHSSPFNSRQISSSIPIGGYFVLSCIALLGGVIGCAGGLINASKTSSVDPGEFFRNGNIKYAVIISVIAMFSAMLIWITSIPLFSACHKASSEVCMLGHWTAEAFFLTWLLVSTVVHGIATTIITYWGRTHRRLLHDAEKRNTSGSGKGKTVVFLVTGLTIFTWLIFIGPTFFLRRTTHALAFEYLSVMGVFPLIIALFVSSFTGMAPSAPRLKNRGRWDFIAVVMFSIIALACLLITFVGHTHSLWFACTVTDRDLCFFEHSMLSFFQWLWTIVLFVVAFIASTALIGSQRKRMKQA